MAMYEEGRFYLSAYGLAVKHGFNGTEAEWLASLKGEKGDQGAALTYADLTAEQKALMVGPKGDKGAKGDKGDKGDTGAAGAAGEDGVNGEDGVDGRGILKIEKVSSSGLTDTYRITFTDNDTWDFTVVNGQNGQNGRDGQNGQDGQDGADGRGIVTIALKETVGKVDTYTITFTDGTTWDFPVINGEEASVRKEITEITLPANGWTGEGPYTQTVSLSLGTLDPERVQVRPLLTIAQSAALAGAGVTAIQTENNDGALTVTVAGACPESDMTIQFEAESVSA